jgi:DNA-directed RNA polymerase subunit L
MEIKILEQSKNRLVIDVEGESHTLCNALKKELWNESHVKIAAYDIKHPLIGVPHIIIETDGEDPKKVLISAAKKLGKKADDFAKLAKKALK